MALMLPSKLDFNTLQVAPARHLPEVHRGQPADHMGSVSGSAVKSSIEGTFISHGGKASAADVLGAEKLRTGPAATRLYLKANAARLYATAHANSAEKEDQLHGLKTERITRAVEHSGIFRQLKGHAAGFRALTLGPRRCAKARPCVTSAQTVVR
jgi:hypothetical protein